MHFTASKPETNAVQSFYTGKYFGYSLKLENQVFVHVSTSFTFFMFSDNAHLFSGQGNMFKDSKTLLRPVCVNYGAFSKNMSALLKYASVFKLFHKSVNI